MNSHNGRERWGSRSAFILAAVGSAVGLGNIWRYPHVAFNAGGGAFLIPYFIALFTAGIPLLMLEFGVGHRMQGSSPAAIGRTNRKYEFVGWWAALGGTLITFYYAVLMGWVCFYLKDIIVELFSTTPQMPWASEGAAHYLEHNATTGSAAVKADINFSAFNWWGVLFNAAVWGFIYFAIRNGVKSVGKVVWVTVLLPYLLLIILFFTAINLEGASAGISYYLTPDWSKFTEDGSLSATKIADIASAAYGQIFFSLSIGFGIMMAYASFLPRKSDIANNAIITSFANSGTEFFAGFITFAVLGFLSLQSGVFVADKVGSSSFGLALISYPTAIGQFSDSVYVNLLLGAAFFGSLLFLGIDSAFSLVEAMVAGLCDKFNVSRKLVAAGLSIFGWLVGMFFCFPLGLPLLDVIDNYLANYGLLMIGLVQCIVLGWLYGTKKIRAHINAVSERRISVYWDVCIKYITPPILFFLLIWQFKKDFAFIWDENAKPYGNLPVGMQITGIGCLVLALTIAFLLCKPKSSREDYFEPPEFNYDDQAL